MFIHDYKGRAGASIGIGVTTYNRLPLLKAFIEAVKDTTSLPYDLVIGDDGSTDGTREWCAENGVPFVGTVNKGIAWNKNRTLYSLMRYSMAGVIILFDDDCFPSSNDWSELWFKATEKHHHVMLVHPRTAAELDKGNTPPEIRGGAGTAEDPYLCGQICGCGISSSRTALNRVGYFDSRFKTYGHEHGEFTLRFHSNGYGIGIPANGEKSMYMLRKGLSFTDAPPTADKTTLAENRLIMDKIKKDGLYRNPWQNDTERELLIAETSG